VVASNNPEKECGDGCDGLLESDEVEVEVSALRMWKLRFLKCGLMLRISERLKRHLNGVPSHESYDLQTFNVRCRLKNLGELLAPKEG
jgi:hypothetical protein